MDLSPMFIIGGRSEPSRNAHYEPAGVVRQSLWRALYKLTKLMLFGIILFTNILKGDVGPN